MPLLPLQCWALLSGCKHFHMRAVTFNNLSLKKTRERKESKQTCINSFLRRGHWFWIMQRIYKMTLAILEEMLSLFVLMSIDRLSTCCRGGIIKHSAGLPRSDAGMAKHIETGRERLSDRGAVKHLTHCQPQGGASWSSPHSLTLLQKMSMLQLRQLDGHLRTWVWGDMQTHMHKK